MKSLYYITNFTGYLHVREGIIDVIDFVHLNNIYWNKILLYSLFPGD